MRRSPFARALVGALVATSGVACNAVFGIGDVYLATDGGDSQSIQITDSAHITPVADARSDAPAERHEAGRDGGSDTTDATVDGTSGSRDAGRDVTREATEDSPRDTGTTDASVGGDATRSLEADGSSPADAFHSHDTGVPLDASHSHDTGLTTVTCDAGCPATLGNGFYDVRGLATDGTHIYLPDTSRQTLFVCSIEHGCGGDAGPDAAPVVFNNVSPQYPTGIVVADGTVYWSTNNSNNQPGDGGVTGGTIQYCPTSGCPESGSSILAFNQNFPTGLAISSGTIFWINLGGMEATPHATIMSCPVANCVTPSVVATAQWAPTSIAADETWVYWTTDDFTTAKGTVSRCPLAGCGAGGPQIVATGYATGALVMPGNGSIWWAQQITGGATVQTCVPSSSSNDAGCGSPTTIFSAGNDDDRTPSAIAVGPATAYFAFEQDQMENLMQGSIASCPVDGGCLLSNRVTTVAPEQFSPYTLLLVGNRLFWNADDHALHGLGVSP